MNKKIIFLFCSCVLLLFTGFGKHGKTVRFNEAGIKFSLQSKAWKQNEKDVQKETYTYITYVRDSSRTKGKFTTPPTLSILLESVSDKMDIVTYSEKKRSRINMKVDKVMTYKDGINIQNAVAYKGNYIDKHNNEQMQILLVILNMNKGMEVTLEAPAGCAQVLDAEFKALINSFQIFKMSD